jgi:hypothetical protein
MKVWVLEANFMNRDRKGVRVFYKKEDVIDALNKLRSADEYLTKYGFTELITEESDTFIRFTECDLLGNELREVAIATELEVE